jgi:hypothetical protein
MVKTTKTPDAATGKTALSICDNVIAKIIEYVKNYNGPMVNYYGLSEFIYMRWDNFTEDEKNYAMDHEFIVKSNTEYYLKKDNTTVKKMLLEENGIVVYVEWR